jgi:hypothetical protein
MASVGTAALIMNALRGQAAARGQIIHGTLPASSNRYCASSVWSNEGDVGNVRFGSKADICAAKRHVRFTPDSDRKSEYLRFVMSALPPIADNCAEMGLRRKADIAEQKLLIEKKQHKSESRQKDFLF